METLSVVFKTNLAIEVRMKHKDGSWVWVYENGKVTEWDNEGKLLKMFGSHIDITKIKISEEDILKKNIVL